MLPDERSARKVRAETRPLAIGRATRVLFGIGTFFIIYALGTSTLGTVVHRRRRDRESRLRIVGASVVIVAPVILALGFLGGFASNTVRRFTRVRESRRRVFAISTKSMSCCTLREGVPGWPGRITVDETEQDDAVSPRWRIGGTLTRFVR